jgi:hypothetical protein
MYPCFCSVFAHLLSGVAVCPVLVLSRSCPVESRGLGAQQASPCAEAPLPRQLPDLSSRLSCPRAGRASSCSCTPLVRGQKPAGSVKSQPLWDWTANQKCRISLLVSELGPVKKTKMVGQHPPCLPDEQAATIRMRAPVNYVQASTRIPCTSASSAIFTSRTCSWTNCVLGSAAPKRCYGSGLPLTLVRRFFPCSPWVRVLSICPSCSSTPCDRCWLRVASPSLPVIVLICTFMR